MDLKVFTVIFASVSALITSVISSFITYKLNDDGKRRDLVFQEKKEAYTGILEAYREVHKILAIRNYYDLESDDDHSLTAGCSIKDKIKAQKDFAYWVMRCKLVASQEVNECIKSLSDSDTDRARAEILEKEKNLENAIRKDLQIK